MSARLRADQLLVQRGLFESRARAQAAIKAGLVVIDGVRIAAASANVAANAAISAEQPHPYVSRGGLKLAAALDAFGIDPAERHCLDVGASTGGFTDVLLQRGAMAVVAVDTGRDQLHAKLRSNPRVQSMEATDIRTLKGLEPCPDLAVIDVSFISIALVLPAVIRLLAPAAELVALIKPQFEVGRAAIGKGGIVRDETARDAAVERIRETVAKLGFTETGLIQSPISGGDGNREYLVAARRIA